MDKDETKRRLAIIRFELSCVASDLMSVGGCSDYVYQGKCDRYSNQISKLITDILEDEINDIE